MASRDRPSAEGIARPGYLADCNCHRGHGALERFFVPSLRGASVRGGRGRLAKTRACAGSHGDACGDRTRLVQWRAEQGGGILAVAGSRQCACAAGHDPVARHAITTEQKSRSVSRRDADTASTRGECALSHGEAPTQLAVFSVGQDIAPDRIRRGPSSTDKAPRLTRGGLVACTGCTTRTRRSIRRR